jgi:hypothetical protein
MDNQTARIVSSLFHFIVAELDDDNRQRISERLDCASQSPLVRECDWKFYRIIYNSFSRFA